MNSNMRCFDFSWSLLLNIDLWVKWMNIIAVFIAIIAAVVAYRQLISSSNESKSATANTIYHNYLSLCFQNPMFSNGMDKPDSHNIIFGQYCWFVSTMLFTFEQILEVRGFDDKWLKAIKSQLLIHKEFLKISSAVNDEVWSDQLQKIIKEVIT